MLEFSILLEACNPEHKHWRSYFITFGQDLLGDWVVEVIYGKIGARGHKKTKLFPDEVAARQEVQRCLKRRIKAPKRIGVPYIVKAVNCPENTPLELWCPLEFR
jgi:predicted DNA-binding WGR domain protein